LTEYVSDVNYELRDEHYELRLGAEPAAALDLRWRCPPPLLGLDSGAIPGPS